MTTPRLVALCSPAMGSGKSSVADHLVLRHDFVPVAFATPLKKMTETLLQATGMPASEIRERVYGDRKEEMIDGINVSSRFLQQTLGTQWGRKAVRDTIWVDICMAAANRLLAAGKSVVIDDMRFPNEYAAIAAAGGTSYRVVRPGAAVTFAHDSEGQLDGISMPEIWNTSCLVDLCEAADRAIFA